MKRKLAGSMWQVKPPAQRSQGHYWSDNTLHLLREPIEPFRGGRMGPTRSEYLTSGDLLLVVGEPVATIDEDPYRRHHRYVQVINTKEGSMKRGYMNETYFVYGSIWLEKLV